jgi:hypothetical protein
MLRGGGVLLDAVGRWHISDQRGRCGPALLKRLARCSTTKASISLVVYCGALMAMIGGC